MAWRRSLLRPLASRPWRSSWRIERGSTFCREHPKMIQAHFAFSTLYHTFGLCRKLEFLTSVRQASPAVDWCVWRFFSDGNRSDGFLSKAETESCTLRAFDLVYLMA